MAPYKWWFLVRSATFVGLGSDFICSNFLGSGYIPFSLKMTPKNFNCFWLIVHLSLLNVRLTVGAISIIFRRFWSCSSLIFSWMITSHLIYYHVTSLYIITSSINANAPMHFSIILSIFFFCNTFWGITNPKCILWKQNLPKGELKVVSSCDFWSSLIDQYPFFLHPVGKEFSTGQFVYELLHGWGFAMATQDDFI